MNRIQITREYAQIEVTSRRAKLNIETPRPEMKIVRSSRARMMVQRSAPRMRINWDKVRPITNQPMQPVRAQSSSEDYRLDIDDRGYMQYRNATGSMVQAAVRGNRLARSRTDMIRNAAAQARSSPLEVRMQALASALEWELGSVHIDWEIDPLQIEWSVSRPRIEVEPYAVEIRMRNYPKLHVSYNPEKVAQVMGRRIDVRI